jgi:hypothetical protein
MDWLNAPVDEFVKMPWDSVSLGCRVIDGQRICHDYLPSNALFKSVELPVTYHANYNEPMFLVVALIYLLVICVVVLCEERGMKCESSELLPY